MTESKNFQKLCDVYDFFEPEMLAVVRDVLRVTPSLRRRSWEFVSIFRALRQAGKLHGGSYGLGMGVGTERLIYGLEPFVGRALLTDLYQPDSGWVAVRTDDPNAMLRARAPWGVDWSKLDARRMDMRHLELPDGEVDFAWSTGAIEHIGEDDDFVRHFDEVARVLKPDGVYVFTTAIAFEPQTVRFAHNYLFNPYHLLELIDRSGLQAAPVFDCAIQAHSLNEPMYEDLTEFGINLARQATPHLVSFRRGVLTTANCMVLRKRADRTPTRVEGFEQSTKWLTRFARALSRDLWEERQGIRVDEDGAKLATPVLYFGKGQFELSLIGAAKSLRLVSRLRGPDKTVRPEGKVKVKDGRATLVFEADSDRIYKITIGGDDRRAVQLWGQRVKGTARKAAAPAAQEPAPAA